MQIISPITRCAMAVLAWLLTAAVFVLQDHHVGQFYILLSIVLALVAVIPKRELVSRANSRTLRIADFLACTYLLGLLVLFGVGGIYAFLQISGLL